MSEIVIPEPIDCVWTGDWQEQNVEHFPGECGYWLDGWGGGPMRPGIERRPIFVICPAFLTDEGVLRGTSFCIDSPATSGSGYWDVTVDMDSLVVGQKPRITVHPSIHLVGIWHGWLQDGVLHQ